MEKEVGFLEELTALINKHSLENGSDTPDFILAAYLENCLIVFNRAMQARKEWYGPPQEDHPTLHEILGLAKS